MIPAKAATMTVEAMANNPVPGLPTMIIAADDPDSFEAPPVMLELGSFIVTAVPALPDVLLLVAVCVKVGKKQNILSNTSCYLKKKEKRKVRMLGYKRELVYIVQEEVAWIGMLPPFGGSWLLPTQAKN
jgi:hypothetical protein